MTEMARCLVASNRPTLIDTSFMCSLRNTDHEPVVKSCSLVPTATTTSASAAIALADVLPVTPSGPTKFGWSASKVALPATVSVTGIPCFSAKEVSSATAPE